MGNHTEGCANTIHLRDFFLGIVFACISLYPFVSTPQGEHYRACVEQVKSHRSHSLPVLKMVKRGLLNDLPADFVRSVAFRGLMITDYLDARCDDMPRMVKRLERMRRLQRLFLGLPIENKSAQGEAPKPEFET